MSSNEPPTIDARDSGVVGDHAVVSGYVAAMVVELVGPRWRQALVNSRVLGEDLAKVEQGMLALDQVAAAWRRERLDALASAGGSTGPAAEGQHSSDAAQSPSWLTTREAAEQLNVSERRIRQLVAEGSLSATRERGRLFLPPSAVAALQQLRRAA